MDRKTLALRNSSIGLASQIVAIVFQFITRSIFVKYLGVELLGISSTFSSVLNTLSLAELGFQSAIIYSLYKPLANNDHESINKIIGVLKIIYRCVGIFFIVAGVICLPLLKYILTEVEINRTVYIIFIIQVANSASSYFLAYKRSLLFADRREFITKIVDTVMNVTINILKIIVVIKTSDYVIYITLTTIQTIASNLIIHIVCGRIYPFLKRTPFDIQIFKSIWNNVKNLFLGKLAFYIYSSTDNIVVSALVSTVSVGFMVNYTTVIANLKTLANSIFNPITPIIGNMVASDDKADTEKIFQVYTYVRYVLSFVIITPTIVLIQDFISVWVGSKYLLSNLIVWLYGLDLYIFFVHGPLCDYINTNGLFKDDRNISVVGAICNIVSSIILAKICGISGVLLGTIISQSVFWILRSRTVYKKVFKSNLTSYWLRNLQYAALFIVMTALLGKMYSLVSISNFLVRFMCGGIMCEIISIVVLQIVFGRTMENVYLKNIVTKKVLKT